MNNYQTSYTIGAYQTNRDTFVIGIRIIRNGRTRLDFMNEIKRISKLLKKDTRIK